jgi:hypothetical protein
MAYNSLEVDAEKTGLLRNGAGNRGEEKQSGENELQLQTRKPENTKA